MWLSGKTIRPAQAEGLLNAGKDWLIIVARQLVRPLQHFQIGLDAHPQLLGIACRIVRFEMKGGDAQLLLYQLVYQIRFNIVGMTGLPGQVDDAVNGKPVDPLFNQ